MSLDSNLDVDKQISDIDQLVSQGVDGIIVFPLDAQAVIPAVERARDAGIKTIGVNVSLEDPEVADVAPFDASVNQGTEQMATETAEFVIDQLGGQGNVLGVGIGFPVPVIDYQMAVMEEAVTAGGLTWLDKVDNPTDDSAGAQPVVEQALLRFDDLQAIMAYNEPSALGAYAAVNAAGRTADILITGANGTESGVAAVEAGEIAATWDLLPWKQGVTFVNVLKALIDGETAETTTVVPVQMLTQDNLSEQVDWDQAVTDIAELHHRGVSSVRRCERFAAANRDEQERRRSGRVDPTEVRSRPRRRRRSSSSTCRTTSCARMRRTSRPPLAR